MKNDDLLDWVNNNCDIMEIVTHLLESNIDNWDILWDYYYSSNDADNL